MYCTSCGNEISAQSHFCSHCGQELEPEKVEKAGPSTEPSPTSEQGVTGTHTEATRAESIGGLDRNVVAALAYVFGFISGLIVYLLEEDDDYVRYHAAQSMVVFGALIVLAIAVNIMSTFFLFLNGLFFGLIDLLFSLVWMFVSLAILVLWVYLIIQAYQGKQPRVPIAADIAEDLV